MGDDSRRFERHFVALHDGDITFDEFARQTLPLWRSLAAQVHQRWRLPHWYSREETVQNFLFAAWKFVWEYDPKRSRGRSIQRFVVWNAYDKAKKAAHVARAARRSGNPDVEPSHVERPLSSYGQEGDSGEDRDQAGERLMHAKGAFTEPDQERGMLEAEDWAEVAVRAWSLANTLGEARALEALAAASTVEDAAQLLYGDEGARAELGIRSEAEAIAVVRRTVRAVAGRLVA